jgi:hypothetical protein
MVKVVLTPQAQREMNELSLPCRRGAYPARAVAGG